MKTCSKCKVAKAASEFHRNSSAPDGLAYQCRACRAEWRRSPRGRAARAWKGIRQRLRSQASYAGRELRVSREEFLAWAEPRFATWDASAGRPSVDRVDNDGHYELPNLQLISVSENSRKDKRSAQAPDGHSWCRTHQSYLPVSKFHRDPSTVTGRNKDCIDCAWERSGSKVRGTPTGENKGNTTVSNAQAREMCQLVDAGVSQAEVARRFSVDPSTVSRMYRGETWGTVTGR